MGTRHLSLLEQKKMQWAKEREEMAGLCAPWGPPESTRPLRKRLEPNLPEEPDEDLQRRVYENLTVPSAKGSPYEDHSISISNTSTDSRGRSTQRERHEVDSRSPSLPPVNSNIQEDPRRRTYYRGREGTGTRPDGFEGYLYLNDTHGLSKSAENFSSSESDPRVKRKAFLSGDRLGDSSSLEKISTDNSPYSSSYQFRNSNLSIATDGDNTWREWGNGRGIGDESRPRWGDRGINMGPSWNPGGHPPVARTGDNLGPIEDYPTPGWVERGLSRMSGDGKGRGGSAEYQRVDPGIRVIVSDEMGGTQRLRGSMNELQHLGYGPGNGINEMSSQRNFEGHSSGMPYGGEIPNNHSSAGTPNRSGNVIEGARGERVIVVGRDVYNASEIVHNGRQYGYGGCISAPSNKSPNYKYKKNDDVTSSLPNLQSSNTHLRGQNVPIDPDIVVEREMRRLKAMELQKAIRQQLDERERKRMQEREQRLKEERELEERSKKQQELERMKKEEEEKKHREKEQMDNKKAELMREALEAAEQDAQKQRKKRSIRQYEEKIHGEELNKTQPDPTNISKTGEHVSNYIISSCCPVITEGGPSILSQPVQAVLDNVDYAMPSNFQPESNVESRSRTPLVYEGATTYHSSSTPLAPFKITLPDASISNSHEGGEIPDPKQGGVLIVGRDVYLLPYVNTEVLAPKLMNGSTYSLGAVGGFDNRILNRDEHCDYRRDWIGSTTRLRTSKDVSTQTEPCSQGPLLLLLRMAGPEDAQNSYEQRSSTDDSSTPENECKEAKEKAFSADAAASHSDCCFCHRTRSQSQPSCSKASGLDVPQRRQQQTDRRPKWGANRPNRKYTTQSEKDPHYSCRNNGQKRPLQARNKRDVTEAVTTEEGSEDLDQSFKSQMKSRPKIELPPSIPNPSSGNGSSRTPTPRNKRHGGKKSTEKTSETQQSDHRMGAEMSQSPLPVLVPPRKEAPRRVQVVKPSLSLDQDSNGHTEHQYSESSANRAQLTFFPTSQLSPISVPSDMKHLLPPMLPVIQQGRLSPIRISHSPIPPVRICSSPSPSVRLCATSMPPIRTAQTPAPSLRQTPVPTTPTLTHQASHNSRHCESPPVPAVLAKMRRDTKSPPRQFSFISSAPDKEEKVTHSRKEARSSTPSVKPQTPGPIASTPRAESKSTVLFVSPREEAPGVMTRRPSYPSSPDAGNRSAALLVTPRDDISVCSPLLNISCPSASSPGADASNALMLVTLSEDISIGTPSPNPLSSMLEVDDKSSFMLVTPSDDISIGLGSRSNFTVSRASQVSGEGMLDGYWEDFVPSAQMLTPYPEANSTATVVEDDERAEETNSDNLEPKDVNKAEEKITDYRGLNDGQDPEEVSIDALGPKDDHINKEIKHDIHKSKGDENDKEIISDSLDQKGHQKASEHDSFSTMSKDDLKAEKTKSDLHGLKDDHKTRENCSDSYALQDNMKVEGTKSDCFRSKDDHDAEKMNDNTGSKDDHDAEKMNDNTGSKDDHDAEKMNDNTGSKDDREVKSRNSVDLGTECDQEDKVKQTAKGEKEVQLFETDNKELSEGDVKSESGTETVKKENEATLNEAKEDKDETESSNKVEENIKSKDKIDSHEMNQSE